MATKKSDKEKKKPAAKTTKSGAKPAAKAKKPLAKGVAASMKAEAAVLSAAAGAADIIKRFFDVPDGSTLRLTVEVEGQGVVFAAVAARNGTQIESWTSAQVRAGRVVVSLASPNRYVVLLDINFTDGPAKVKGSVVIEQPEGDDRTWDFTVEGEKPDHAQVMVGVATVPA